MASASLGRAYNDEPLGRYNLLPHPIDEGGHRIEIIGRGLTVPGGGVSSSSSADGSHPRFRCGLRKSQGGD